MFLLLAAITQISFQRFTYARCSLDAPFFIPGADSPIGGLTNCKLGLYYGMLFAEQNKYVWMCSPVPEGKVTHFHCSNIFTCS